MRIVLHEEEGVTALGRLTHESLFQGVGTLDFALGGTCPVCGNSLADPNGIRCAAC